MLTLPAEVWSYVFRFLDIPSLLKAQLSCKFFHQLGIEETLWKEKCISCFPTITWCNHYDFGGWNKLYRGVRTQDVQGSRTHIIFFDGWDPNETLQELTNYAFQIVYRTMRSNLDHFACNGVLGKGQARWGYFAVLGCGWGNFYSFTHIYSSVPAIFSNLIGKVVDKEGKVMNGYWKTAWQGATGSFFSGKDGASVERPPTANASSLEDTSIIGKWELSIIGDEGSTISSKMKLVEVSHNGYYAEITWKEKATQMALGNIYGRMVSFTFLWPDFSNIVTAVAELQEGNKTMRGRALLCDGNFSTPQCCLLFAKREQAMAPQSE